MKIEEYTPQTNTKEKAVFGKWEVSKGGDMNYNNGNYEIYSNQLDEQDWMAHMFEKSWIDWNEFIPAYFQALKNAGIKETTVLVHY